MGEMPLRHPRVASQLLASQATPVARLAHAPAEREQELHRVRLVPVEAELARVGEDDRPVFLIKLPPGVMRDGRLHPLEQRLIGVDHG